MAIPKMIEALSMIETASFSCFFVVLSVEGAKMAHMLPMYPLDRARMETNMQNIASLLIMTLVDLNPGAALHKAINGTNTRISKTDTFKVDFPTQRSSHFYLFLEV